MANLDAAYAALQKADAAGDTAGAKQLADYIRTQQQDTTASKPAPSSFDTLVNTAKNLYGSFLEPAATLASGAIAKPLSDVAGLAAIPANALGLTSADPADVKAAVQNGMTYQPRTDAGKETTALIGKIADATVGNATRYVGDKAAQAAAALGASPSTADVVRSGATETAAQLPTLAGLKLPALGASRVATAADQALADAPMVAAAQQAKNAGFVLSPNSVGAGSGTVAKNAANIASNAQLETALALKNQGTVNNIAKAEGGIPQSAPLTQGSIDAAKADAGKAYDAVRGADARLVLAKDANGNIIQSASGKPVVRPAGPVKPDATLTSDINAIGSGPSNPNFATPVDAKVKALKDRMNNIAGSPYSPGDSIDEIGRLRQNARVNLKNTGDTEKLDLGHAQMQAADALEGQMGRYLDSTGQTDLYKNFTAARQRLAKLHSIDEAYDSAAGVNPDVLAQIANRKGGFVAGGLKDIVDANTNFGNVVKGTAGLRPPGLGVFDALAGIGAAGSAAAHAAVGNIPGAALSAAALARPAVRQVLQSKLYQRGLGQGIGTPAGTLSQLANSPASPLIGLLSRPQQPQN